MNQPKEPTFTSLGDWMKWKLSAKIKLIIRKRKKNHKTGKSRRKQGGGRNRFKKTIFKKSSFFTSWQILKKKKFRNWSWCCCCCCKIKRSVIGYDRVGDVSVVAPAAAGDDVAYCYNTNPFKLLPDEKRNFFSSSRSCPSAGPGLTQSWLVPWGPRVQGVRPCSWSPRP